MSSKPSHKSKSTYHVDIKLVQAPEGRLCDLPESQDEADRGEGALASWEGTHVIHVVFFLTGGFHLSRNK